LSDLADALDIELQRAAAYTRYAEKLVETIGLAFAKASKKPSPIKDVDTDDNAERAATDRELRHLTRDAVVTASKHLRWNKQLPKWTVLVEGTPFPVRPLAFKAAGLLPNDRATTHQAVSVLKHLGFAVFYEGKPA
jgi:hypothetical protein